MKEKKNHINFKKFKNLDYGKFRELALDHTLTPYEKIGFPDEYRKGYEANIFKDIRVKLSNLDEKQKVIVDIGCGCSEIPHMLINLCERNEHKLILIDSEEMLALLPDKPFISKIAGYYPRDFQTFLQAYKGKVDVIITYSVIQYVFNEYSIFDFIDKSLNLLNENGQMLLGDIPNVSKRKRFFASAQGIKYHMDFMESSEPPEVVFNNLEFGQIDDSVVMSILQRARSAGFDSYVLPQNKKLPMENRREDILIIRP